MPNRLHQEISSFESAKIRETLVRAEGNIKRAAELLGMPTSTLFSSLARRFPELLEEAREIRARRGNERGRPRIEAAVRTKKAVGAAWRKSNQCLADASRMLGIPASSLRDLIIRYGLPMKEKGSA